MAKTIEPPLLAPAAVPVSEQAVPATGASRFRCLPAAGEDSGEDEEWLDDDDDGFQCPCCLKR
jgi:hypothetical protein